MQLKKNRDMKQGVRITVFTIAAVLMLASFLYSTILKKSMNEMDGFSFKVEGTITAVDFSQDGKLTYLGMRDNKVIALNQEEKTEWEYKTEGPVLDLKTNGEFTYISDDSRKLYILDDSGRLIRNIKVGYRPMVVSGSSDGQRVITGTSMSAMKNRLQLYDASGKQIYSIDPSDVVSSVYFLPDGTHAVYASRGAKVYLVDDKGKKVAENKIEYYPVDMDYNFKQKAFIIADEGNNIYCFNEDIKLQWKTNFDTKINAVGIDPINNQILVTANDGYIIVLDQYGKEISRFTCAKGLRNIAINTANGQVYTIKGNNELTVYDNTIFSNFSRIQLLIKITNITNIVFAVVLLIAVLGLSSKLSSTVTKKMSQFFKIIFRYRLSYLLLLPTITLLIIFNYYPAISGLVLAFTDYKPGIYMHWVGLENFKSMVTNPYFWTGVGNMLIFLITDMLKALVPPIIFAELIIAMKSKGAQYWTRVALYLPGILPGIAGLLVWTSGILGQNGVINETLRAIGLGNWAMPWLGTEHTAIWALVFIGFPFIGSYIIFYGALIGVPNSLFDAAKIDGCGWWRRITSIDVPMISPQIKFVFVTGFIASVQNFGLVYVTTMGGPGHSTYTPMLELFYNMSKFQKYGVAAAMGLFLFIVIFGATLMNLRIQTAHDKM